MRGTLADEKLITMLLDRLERISVDSIWAHRAGGIRGSLLRSLDQIQQGEPIDPKTLRELITTSFHILRQAAREKG
jgi:hypothetical protein